MNPFRFFFRSERAALRRGTTASVEAALRAKRARDHLARKRRSGRRGEDPTHSALDASRSAADTTAERGVGASVPPQRTPPPNHPHHPHHPTHPHQPHQPHQPTRPLRPRATPARPATTRAPVVPRRIPGFVAPTCTALALVVGFVAARPLFERLWLPRAPLARVAVLGTGVRSPETVARALLPRAGAPLDRIRTEQVQSLVTADPWFASAESVRLPTGTLLVRVVERRAIARHRRDPDDEVALVDPEGRRFMGDVGAGGALPLVAGPVDDEAPLAETTLEILAELRLHEAIAGDPSSLTLHLPGSRERDARGGASGDELQADESGYVLEIGRDGPRVLLGQTLLKRRIARLAALLAQRDALLAGASVIDLRYADRAVLRTEPTSG